MLIGPTRIFQGDSASWIEHADIRWQKIPKEVKIQAFLKVGEEQAKLIAKPIKEGLDLTLGSDESEKLSPGIGYIVCIFANSEICYSKTMVLGSSISVMASPTSKDFDPRTEAEKALAQAKKALQRFTETNGRVKSYTIGTRQLQFRDVGELQKLVEYWEFQVMQERAARYGLDPRVSLVRFRND
ncbi:hypothetical protein [Turicimonas sp. TL08]